MSGVNRHPRLPQSPQARRRRRDRFDDLLTLGVAVVVTLLVLAWAGVFDGVIA